MNTWGNKLKLSIFGESHGKSVGIILDGIPAGLEINMDFIASEMKRRAPGQNRLSTPRKEADEVEIQSGILNGITTGTPICALIPNTNIHSADYTPELLRPSHADFTGFAKYGDSHDFRGGGHFSGRITAGLVFAGAISKLWLSSHNISIASHIKKLHGIEEKSFMETSYISADLFKSIISKDFPVIDDSCGEQMKNEILDATVNKDSVGGIIECAVLGVNAGIGSPFFASLESNISSLVFSIPGVKGIEFGSGFDFSDMLGSEANDCFKTDGKNIFTLSNHNGGINGGISNGMPIIFSTVIKPTPSIAKPQQTVNKDSMENTTIEIKGRHDPCILQRAAVVVESAAALAILDAILFS